MGFQPPKYDLQKCDKCGFPGGTVRRRRMNTQYHDDESNFCVACEQCFEEIQEEWHEKWQEYYEMTR